MGCTLERQGEILGVSIVDHFLKLSPRLVKVHVNVQSDPSHNCYHVWMLFGVTFDINVQKDSVKRLLLLAGDSDNRAALRSFSSHLKGAILCTVVIELSFVDLNPACLLTCILITYISCMSSGNLMCVNRDDFASFACLLTCKTDLSLICSSTMSK